MNGRTLSEVWAVNDAAASARLALNWRAYIASLEQQLCSNLRDVRR